jgi:hypothetical protein
VEVAQTLRRGTMPKIGSRGLEISSSVKPFRDHPMRLSDVRLSSGRLIVTVAIVAGLIWICLASDQGRRTLEFINAS